MRNFRASPLIARSALLVGLVSSPAHAATWNSASDPFIIGPRFEARLDLLPLSAELPANLPTWSGPYWSNRKGSINYRWQTTQKLRSSDLKSLADLKRDGPAAIALLSPAEKIDIARAKYDYPTVGLVRAHAKIFRKSWEGLCAGWSQSSLNFEEPRPFTYRNADGLEIRFGSGDLKALAAFYYDFIAVSESGADVYDDRTTAQMGRRCVSSDVRDNCEYDLNPGALHILLANRIGLESQGVLADFSKGTEVWQHPIHGFSAEILSERTPADGSAPNAVREVQVRTSLHYAGYAAADWNPTGLQVETRQLKYWLELDASDRIVGGSYSGSSSNVLDYAWVSGELRFSRGYEILNELLIPKSHKFTIPTSSGE